MRATHVQLVDTVRSPLLRRWLDQVAPAPVGGSVRQVSSWPAWPAFAGWLVALMLASVGATLAIGAGGSDDGSGALLAGQVGLWAGFVGTAVIASRQFGSGDVRADFGFTIRVVDIARSALVGVVVQVIVVPAIYLPLVAAGVDLDVWGPAEELFHALDGLARIAIAAGVIVVAPVAEELLFRGVLLKGLASRFGSCAAIWASSLLFAGTHFQAVQFPGLLAIGLTLAWLARRTGGVAAPIWAHAAFNATTVALLW